nr:hypothetical protein [Tanacetum cinerariifolium]
MPHKPDLVFADEHVVSESVTSLPDIKKSKVNTSETQLKNVSAPIIEDWVSDSDDENEIETESNQIKPSFAKVSDSEDENEIKTESNQIKPSFVKVKFVNAIEHVKSPSNLLRKKRIKGKPNTLGKTVKVLE